MQAPYIPAQIQECLNYLASICDFAEKRDNQGFNKVDAFVGRRLASVERMTIGETIKGGQLVHKYRKQLQSAGMNIPTKEEIDYFVEQVKEDQIIRMQAERKDRQTDSQVDDEEQENTYKIYTIEFRERGKDIKRIVVQNPYNKKIYEEAIKPLKDKTDWKFNRSKENKEWDYPIEEAHQVIEALDPFLDQFDVDDEISVIAAKAKKDEEIARQIAEIEAEIERRETEMALQNARPYLEELPLPNGQTLYKHQCEAIQMMIEKKRMILAHDIGLGKAQPLDAKILTPNGWKEMGDIQIGDEVINSQGGTSRVTGVFPQGKKDIYRVMFSDGSYTECCDEHLWAVNTPVRNKRGNPFQVLPLKEIMHNLRLKNGSCKHFIPMVKPIEFKEQELPLDPYLLGALIGDGGLSRGCINITSVDDEIIDTISERLPDGVWVKQSTDDKYIWRLTTGNKGKKYNPVTEALKKLELHGHLSNGKFIPKCYLFSSVASRTELLQGLLDTDGCVREVDNNIEFSTSSAQLAVDMVELVQSLGGRATIRYKDTYYMNKGKKINGQSAYRMSIALPEEIKPFKLSRKANIYKPRAKYPPSRAIVNVEHIGEREAQCIAVDAPDHLYITDDYIVTHNSKSSLVAAKSFELPIIVIAPVSVHINWLREAAMVEVGIEVYSWAKLPEPPDGDFVLIGDEAHNIQGLKSIRSQAFLELADKARAVFALTGTPIKNGKPINIFNLLVACKHLLGNNRIQFEKKYCNGHFKAIGKKEIWDNTGASNMDVLHHRIKDIVLYKRKRDCLDLPPKTRVMRGAEVRPEDKRDYANTIKNLRSEHKKRAKINKEEAIKQLIAEMVDCDPEEIKAEQAKLESILNENEANARALVDIGILRHAASRAKVETAIELAQEVIEEGGSIVLFAEYRDTAKRLAEALETDCIQGGMSKEARQKAIDDFQARKKKAIVCMIKAAGEGITLTAAQTLIMVDRDWTPGGNEQCEGRIDRIGQTENVTCIWLQYGIDERIDMLLEQKQERIDFMLRGKVESMRGIRGLRALAKDIMDSIYAGESIDDWKEQMDQLQDSQSVDDTASQRASETKSQNARALNTQIDKDLDSQRVDALDSQSASEVETKRSSALDSKEVKALTNQLANALATRIAGDPPSRLSDYQDSQEVKELTIQIAGELKTQLAKELNTQHVEKLDSKSANALAMQIVRDLARERLNDLTMQRSSDVETQIFNDLTRQSAEEPALQRVDEQERELVKDSTIQAAKDLASQIVDAQDSQRASEIKSQLLEALTAQNASDLTSEIVRTLNSQPVKEVESYIVEEQDSQHVDDPESRSVYDLDSWRADWSEIQRVDDPTREGVDWLDIQSASALTGKIVNASDIQDASDPKTELVKELASRIVNDQDSQRARYLKRQIVNLLESKLSEEQDSQRASEIKSQVSDWLTLQIFNGPKIRRAKEQASLRVEELAILISTELARQISEALDSQRVDSLDIHRSSEVDTQPVSELAMQDVEALTSKGVEALDILLSNSPKRQVAEDAKSRIADTLETKDVEAPKSQRASDPESGAEQDKIMGELEKLAEAARKHAQEIERMLDQARDKVGNRNWEEWEKSLSESKTTKKARVTKAVKLSKDIDDFSKSLRPEKKMSKEDTGFSGFVEKLIRNSPEFKEWQREQRGQG